MNVSQMAEPGCLGGWCRVGSVVLSEFYINEAEQRRTVSKVVPYDASHENGMVWTNDPRLHSLEGVDFKDWIRPLSSGPQRAKIFS